jgi:opacity protein-like surface antigen
MGSQKSLAKAVLASAALASAAAQAQTTQSYWRVDLGASKSVGADIHDKDYSVGQVINGDPNNTTPGSLSDAGTGVVAGAGFGWQFNPRVRGDITLGYRRYRLDTSDGSDTRFKADISSLALMVGAYYENDAASGPWKPYIGAGLGVARNKFGDFTGTTTGGTFSGPGGMSAGFAWMVTTGFGFPVLSGRVFDVGYRYVDLGKLETAGGNLSDGAGNLLPTSGFTGRLRAHELLIGMRF